MGHSSGDGDFFHRRRRRRLLVGDRRKSDPDSAGRGPVGGQSRRQGDSQRSGDVRSLRDGHLRHQHRVGQHDARFADAARGHGPDVQPARRLHLARRRRRGPLWFPRARDHRGVRRRADGRPHARISRQEDRSARNEIRDARGADLSAGGAGLHGRFGPIADRARQPEQQRPAWPLGNHLRLRLEPTPTTVRRSPG